ncbi:MAG: hypothetical protein VX111_11450, partial [Planctomycetota bacterium]|nr:hypothetical protein [Planctomycetota bacterium]
MAIGSADNLGIRGLAQRLSTIEILALLRDPSELIFARISCETGAFIGAMPSPVQWVRSHLQTS